MFRERALYHLNPHTFVLLPPAAGTSHAGDGMQAPGTVPPGP